METIYDEELPVLERIKLPMVWERLATDVRVEDLLPPRYDEAMGMIKDYFIKDEPMCKGCKLEEEEESVKEFLALVLFWMHNTQSFVAVEEATNEVVGVLVGRVNEKKGHTNAMSSTRIYRSNACGKLQRFRSHISKQADLYKLYDIDSFYQVCVWCVVPDQRGKGIGKALLRAAIEQTISFKMTLVSGLFTGVVSQQIAQKMGFQTEFEILYWQWIEEDAVVFVNTGAGNNSANLMVTCLQMIDKSSDGEFNNV